MSTELKTHMRLNKRRVLPNSKEMVVNYNRRTPPDTIPEHNDPMRIDWTELPPEPSKAPEYIAGKEALRIPDNSRPRYRLYWPIRHGWINEQDYDSKRFLYHDIQTIIEEAVKSQLGLARRDWAQYSCVFIIPDLYDKTYVTSLLNMGIAEFGFARVSFFQESLAASFGAGYTTTCIVDIGAQKTSICCVEEGMCIENSRVNLKYGGQDVTETFVKMMLFDHFPYADINLKRRYDYLLAEELKQRFCTMNEADVSVQLFDFHLRASGQDTRKYTFKAYDEVLLAPLGFFKPAIFDGQGKLDGRRKLINRSFDIYDGKPNDPTSQAQAEILTAIAPAPTATTTASGANATNGTNGHNNGPDEESKDLLQPRPQSFSRLQDGGSKTPLSSIAGSPAPDLEATPQPDLKDAVDGANDSDAEEPVSIERRDDILPVYPLDSAILTSIIHAARSSPQKTRDFLGGIMLIGGSSTIPGLAGHLEEALQALQPGYAKDVMIGRPPRELDAQVVVWKGGSVFGRMARTNDSW
jgi:actin-related protein 8